MESGLVDRCISKLYKVAKWRLWYTIELSNIVSYPLRFVISDIKQDNSMTTYKITNNKITIKYNTIIPEFGGTRYTITLIQENLDTHVLFDTPALDIADLLQKNN